VDRFRTQLDAKLVLGDLPRNAWHVRGLPCEGITIGKQEVNEHAFLFGQKLGLDLHGIGRVTGVDTDRLGVLIGRKALDEVGSLVSGALSVIGRKALDEVSRVGDGGGVLEVLTTAGVRLLEGAADCDDAIQP
jgi:hypothetical protein